MRILILAAVGFVISIILFRRVRAVVFHVKVRQFLKAFLFVLLTVAVGGTLYAAWKYWWPIYMKTPTVEWTDTTLEQDENPVTPGAGGPIRPTEIQVR